MQIHHDKHHQTYVTKLQTAISQAPALKGKSLVRLLGSGHVSVRPFYIQNSLLGMLWLNIDLIRSVVLRHGPYQ